MRKLDNLILKVRSSNCVAALNQAALHFENRLRTATETLTSDLGHPPATALTTLPIESNTPYAGQLDPFGHALISKGVTHIAIDQWRLERRIQRLEASSPGIGVAGVYDSAQRIEESLRELGVTIAEHDGTVHDPGALYEVVHIREECDTQVVVETIAPSVLINERIVKHGQVVIGCESTEKDRT